MCITGPQCNHRQTLIVFRCPLQMSLTNCIMGRTFSRPVWSPAHTAYSTMCSHSCVAIKHICPHTRILYPINPHIHKHGTFLVCTFTNAATNACIYRCIRRQFKCIMTSNTVMSCKYKHTHTHTQACTIPNRLQYHNIMWFSLLCYLQLPLCPLVKHSLGMHDLI